MSFLFLLFIVLFVGWPLSSLGQTVTEANPTPPTDGQGTVAPSGKFSPKQDFDSPATAGAQSIFRSLGQGIVEIGAVRVDQVQWTVTIPCSVNMTQGIVEYVLVEESGKLHESILQTKASAEHIHIACLLLGMTDGTLLDGQELPPAGSVEIELSWDTNGPEKKVSLAEVVHLNDSDPSKIKPMSPGAWFYEGSRMDAGGFVASREGSIVALIADEMALVSNPRESRVNDGAHLVNRSLLPDKGTPVRMILKLPKPPAAEAPSE
ncbi:YdjY domain-containing protein [Verrucomicrobiaceae bacterium 227]